MESMSVAIEEILSLDVKARLELIEEIWDSISAQPEAVPLTATQRKELDRRKRAHRRDPSKAKPWSEVFNRLEKRNEWKRG
jgi:putative addiction module component (TIGR02574 family)